MPIQVSVVWLMALELTDEEYAERLRTSTTLYVGNLSFFTLESQLIEVFS